MILLNILIQLFIIISIHFLCQIILFRLLSRFKKNFSPQKVLYILSIILNIIFILEYLLLHILFKIDTKTIIFNMLYVFISYNFYLYMYFQFFNISQTGRRLKILREIYFLNKNNIQSLKKNYNNNFIIKKRIERLKSWGQIEERKNKYFLKKHLFLFSSYFFLFLQYIFNIKKNQ